MTLVSCFSLRTTLKTKIVKVMELITGAATITLLAVSPAISDQTRDLQIKAEFETHSSLGNPCQNSVTIAVQAGKVFIRNDLFDCGTGNALIQNDYWRWAPINGEVNYSRGCEAKFGSKQRVCSDGEVTRSDGQTKSTSTETGTRSAVVSVDEVGVFDGDGRFTRQVVIRRDGRNCRVVAYTRSMSGGTDRHSTALVSSNSCRVWQP